MDDLVRRAKHIGEIEAVIVVGSLASNTADTMSDVDAIVVLREGAFAAGHNQRHSLHATTTLACWDQYTSPSVDIAAHKWIDDRGVLVEVLMGTNRDATYRPASHRGVRRLRDT